MIGDMVVVVFVPAIVVDDLLERKSVERVWSSQEPQRISIFCTITTITL